jgi:glycosyltransferase involved in cell wall biosynthesis
MTATSREGPGPAAAAAEATPPIAEPYALFVCQPLEVDERGRRWTVDGWAKDLALHLDYIEDLTLVSPAIRVRERSAGTVSLDEPPFDRLKFVDLPHATTKAEALRTLPRHLGQYWRAVGGARVVHAGFAGWPIIMGWVAVPLARLRGRFALANVESSPWRAPGAGLPWHRRLRGAIGEVFTRAAIRMADLRLFTSRAYLEELLPPGSPRAFVTPATWLNEEWILPDEAAEACWDAKRGPVRLLFAARMLPQKGVEVLLGAIRSAAEAGADVAFSIIGTGPMREDCVAAARQLAGRAAVDVLDEVPYGEPFLELLRGFDAALVPSLSDEQPRIAYDALSQAVPVIGSSTGGIREVVESGVTGRLSPPGDVGALAESILWAAGNRPALRAMGLRGPAAVRDATHQAMHRNRHRLLRQALDGRLGRPRPARAAAGETA